MVRRDTLLLSAVVAAVLVGAATMPVVGAQSGDQPEPSLTVALDADGDARVAVTYMYDLADESDQAAFDQLRTNETFRTAKEDGFTQDWQVIADNTENRTDRAMAVRNSSLALSRTNSTGVATFSLTWTGLAAAADGTLTLSEPFANGYTPDRPLVVVLPDGYQLTSVSPGPTNTTDGRLVYEAGSDLDGLSVVATSTTAPAGTPAPSPTSTTGGTTGGSGPGFGVVGALAALAAAGLLAGRE